MDDTHCNTRLSTSIWERKKPFMMADVKKGQTAQLKNITLSLKWKNSLASNYHSNETAIVAYVTNKKKQLLQVPLSKVIKGYKQGIGKVLGLDTVQN